MLYEVRHITTYEYKASVSSCHNLAHLRPRNMPNQQVSRFRLKITPEPSRKLSRLDYYGNETHYAAVQYPHSELTFEAESRVNVVKPEMADPKTTPPWEDVRRLPGQVNPIYPYDILDFTFASPLITLEPEALEYAKQTFTPRRPLLEGVIELTSRIHKDFQYKPGATTVSSTIKEIFSKRLGVCQDFAHLEIACLRSLGLPARYVSGYLRTIPPPGQPRLQGADASHAWVAVFCPGTGWIAIDPTNDVLTATDHITVGWGRDYADVAPVTGAFIGGNSSIVRVGVDVIPQEELQDAAFQQQSQSILDSSNGNIIPEPPDLPA
ncbi:Cysteine protease [Planctomycetales bacterium 10988]|nr:Cysteine protease [Planctomycetales bacterium 10988]